MNSENQNKNFGMLKKLIFGRSKKLTCIKYMGKLFGNKGYIADDECDDYYAVEIDPGSDNTKSIEQLWKDHKVKMTTLFESNIPEVPIRKLHGCDYLIVKKILYEISEKILHSTHVTDKVELQFINGASHGGYIYCQKGEYDGGFTSYDINSEYPSIMKTKKFKFPIKGGRPELISQDKIDRKQIGIYKIKITSTVDPAKFKKFSDGYDYYTNYDLKDLHRLKYTYEIDMKSEYNAFLYNDDDCVTGKELFGEYIDILYEIKLNKYKNIKKVLNMLWGEACSSKKTKVPIEQMNRYKPEDFISFNHETDTLYLRDSEQPYNWTFCRMKPFLLSSGRSKIGKIAFVIQEDGYKVIKIHTDSILTNCKPDEMENYFDLDNQIGHLKVEKTYKSKFKIVHCNKTEII